MIISHRHRFIFFAVPKTATHAIREVLRTHMGDGDWEQQVLFGRQALPIPELAKLGHGHLSVRQVRPHLSEETWHSYYKFAFVRNPYDRFISICFFLNRDNPQFAANAVTFMKAALGRQRFRERLLVKPQFLQLVDANGDLAMNQIGRYENLTASLDLVCEQLGLPAAALQSKNSSQHGGYKSYIDEELRGMIANFYSEDISRFDYAF